MDVVASIAANSCVVYVHLHILDEKNTEETNDVQPRYSARKWREEEWGLSWVGKVVYESAQSNRLLQMFILFLSTAY